MKSAWRWLGGFVARLEDQPLGPAPLLAGLAAIIAVRTMLEIMVARNPVFVPLAAFVHYPLAYAAPFLALTMVLALWSRTPVQRVARLMLLAWTLTILPPLFDVALHRSRATPTIGYLLADPADLPWLAANFLNPTVRLIGATPGIRLEIAVAVVLGVVYVLLKTGRPLRALGAAPSLYCVAFAFPALPVIVQGLFRVWKLDLTGATFWHGEGLLIRPDRDAAPDSIALCWLVPAIVGLALLWRAAEGRSPDLPWIRGEAGTNPLPGLAPALSIVVLTGAMGAVWLHLGGDRPLSLAPYDVLAIPAAACAVALLANAVVRGSASTPLRAGLAILGAALAAGLGRSVAVPLAAAVLPWLALEARWAPPWLRRAAVMTCAGVTSLAAFAAGYGLVIGPEALARAPFTLLGLALSTGLGLGVALGVDGATPSWSVRVLAVAFGVGLGALPLGRPLFALSAFLIAAGLSLLAVWAEGLLAAGRRGVVLGALTALCVFVVVRGAVATDALRAPLELEARCVARLAEIRAKDYEDAGQWSLAKTFYVDALRCDPNHVPALRGLGLIYLRHEKEARLNKAVEHLEQAARLAPDSTAEWSNLAAAHLEAARPADALAAIERALALDSRDPNSLFNHARCLEDLGRPEAAIAAWERFVQRAQRLPESAGDVRFARQRLRALRLALAPPGPRDAAGETPPAPQASAP